MQRQCSDWQNWQVEPCALASTLETGNVDSICKSVRSTVAAPSCEPEAAGLLDTSGAALDKPGLPRFIQDPAINFEIQGVLQSLSLRHVHGIEEDTGQERKEDEPSEDSYNKRLWNKLRSEIMHCQVLQVCMKHRRKKKGKSDTDLDPQQPEKTETTDKRKLQALRA